MPEGVRPVLLLHGSALRCVPSRFDRCYELLKCVYCRRIDRNVYRCDLPHRYIIKHLLFSTITVENGEQHMTEKRVGLLGLDSLI